MALAETAQLAVNLHLGTSGSFKGVSSELKGVEAAAASGSRGASGFGNALSSVSKKTEGFRGALSHAKGEIGGLVAGPLGFIGLTAGVLSVGGAIEKGVEKAATLGTTIEKLSSLTGDSAEHLSGLVAVFEKFGVGTDKATRALGFLEKNVGLMAVNTQLETKFESEFGFSIRDTTVSVGKYSDALGVLKDKKASASDKSKAHAIVLDYENAKVKDGNALILQAADYWTGNASQAQKAALESKLFGRSYADLIPVLALGSKGIKDAEEEAGKLGLTLNRTNVQDLAKFRDSTRTLGDAMGGLQLQIGLALIPALTDLAKNITGFVSSNRDNIVKFFRDGAQFAKDMGHTVETDVIPVFKGIAGAWNSVPPELRDLLVKGFIAGKVSKILFDFGPLDALKAGGGLLGKIGGEFFKRGGTPANPLFVADVTGGGIAGAAEGAGGGLLGKLGSTILKVSVIGIAAGVAYELLGIKNQQDASLAQQEKGLTSQTTGFAKSSDYQTIKASLDALNAYTESITSGKQDLGITAAYDFNINGVKDSIDQQKSILQAQLDTLRAQGQANGASNGALGEHANDLTVAAINKANATLGRGIQEGHRDTDKLSTAFGRGDHTITDLLKAAQKDDRTHRDFHSMLDALGKLTKASDIKSSADKLTHELTHGIGGIIDGNRILADLQRQQKAAIAAGDTKLARSLGVDIHKVEAALPGKAFAAKELHTAESILNSTKSSKDKLEALRKIQADLKAHGDTKAAGIIAEAIRRKKLSTTVTVNNRISTRISVSAKQLHDYVVTYQRAGAIVGNKV